MVSYINKLRDGGMGLHDAVITGASVRLRAELLSAFDRQHKSDSIYYFFGHGRRDRKASGDCSRRRTGDSSDPDCNSTDGVRMGRTPLRQKGGSLD